MDNNELDQLAEATDKVIRQSQQPKYNNVDPQKFFSGILNWVEQIDRSGYDYETDSRKRDKWLRKFAREENYLSGVLSTSVSLDVNRGFTLIGGRNQVIRYRKRLANIQNGQGWRAWQTLSSQDFYNTDMGKVAEIETDTNGAMISLYHVDAARTKLTGDYDYPLEYYPVGYKPMKWGANDYYRIASMINPDEKYNGLGYCAVSRCVKLARIMIAVTTYNLEKLGELSPKGLLLLESDSMTPEMWEEATETRREVYQSKTGNAYFDNLMVMVDRALKGQLIELSGMPDKFDPFMFTDYMMRGYALAFNRDARAFWSVNSGAFGGSQEAQIQYERATHSGLVDYLKMDQEQLQKLLPTSLTFEYEEDDTQGKMMKAQLAKEWTDVGLNLQELGVPQQAILKLLVENNILADEWLLDGNSIITDDTLSLERERLLQKPTIQRAIERFGDEPIVKWSYPSNDTTVIWERGSAAIKSYHHIQFDFQLTKQRARVRQRPIHGVAINLNNFTKLTELALSRKIRAETYDDRLKTLTTAGMVRAYLHHSANRDQNAQILYSTAGEVLTAGYIGKGDGLTPAEISSYNTAKTTLYSTRRDEVIAGPALNQIKEIEGTMESTQLSQDIYLGYYDDMPDEKVGAGLALVLYRIGLLSEMGKVYEGSGNYRWQVGNTDHCNTCSNMAGLIMSAEEWQGELLPKSSGLECGGWRCDCYLEKAL